MKKEQVQELKARNIDLVKWLEEINQKIQLAKRELIRNDAQIELLEKQLLEEKIIEEKDKK